MEQPLDNATSLVNKLKGKNAHEWASEFKKLGEHLFALQKKEISEKEQKSNHVVELLSKIKSTLEYNINCHEIMIPSNIVKHTSYDSPITRLNPQNLSPELKEFIVSNLIDFDKARVFKKKQKKEQLFQESSREKIEFDSYQILTKKAIEVFKED
jgi:hypothetical protein